jgi:hypothetical protein
MYYSPVRHLVSPLLVRFSFDLHVLSTPPAFTLSQDQTLHILLYGTIRSYCHCFFSLLFQLLQVKTLWLFFVVLVFFLLYLVFKDQFKLLTYLISFPFYSSLPLSSYKQPVHTSFKLHSLFPSFFRSPSIVCGREL